MENYNQQSIQQLAIFKIVPVDKQGQEEGLLFCSFANTQEEAVEYLESVQKSIDYECNHTFEGEYLVIPALYFNLKRNVFPTSNNASKTQV